MKPTTGQGIDRVDGRAKIIGRAHYSYEIAMPGVAYAVLITSPIASGTISSVDSAAAARAPGVLAVLTCQNAPRLPNGGDGGTLPKGSTNAAVQRKLSLLQDNNIYYSNQPIGVVVAATLEQAEAAAALVRFHFNPTAHVVQPAQQTPYMPKALSHGDDKIDMTIGGPDAQFASAAHKVDATYTSPFEFHNPMEPHATTAHWQGDHLLLYDATQGVFTCRSRVADVLGLPKENVRVVSHFLGGGFGSKGPAWSHVVLTAMAARHVGRPVKLAMTRPQMFGPLGQRPYLSQHVRLGAQADGKLMSVENHITCATSVFDEWIETAAMPARMLYATPTQATSHRGLRLNMGTPSFMRAPGENPGVFAVECAMDELSWQLGMDPVALRLANYAEQDPGTQKPFSSKSLRECYRQGAERFGWAQRAKQPRSQRDGRWLLGWGMATAEYPAHQGAASARASIDASGHVLCQAGTQDIGTGTYTIMTQIAAHQLGLEPAQVTFELGDTEFPETPVSGGSQTAASTGSAVMLAAQALARKLKSLASGDSASPLHGVAADDMQLSGGHIQGGGKSEPLTHLVHRNGGRQMAEIEVKPAEDRKKWSTYAFGAHFGEVAVDEDLGIVRVRRMVSAIAAGNIVNAKTARSQIQGGVIMGLGQALMEEGLFDAPHGRLVNMNLAEYLVPVNADVPPIDVIFVPEDDPHVNPAGIKGIGEIGIVGVAAVIANAVYHATGRRVRDLPITVDKILGT